MFCDNRTWISKCLNASSHMFWIHFRLFCQLQLVMCTIEMKLATFLPVTLRRWMILLSWSSDLDFLCLEAGKLSTTLVTMFPAINISLTRVRTLLRLDLSRCSCKVWWIFTDIIYLCFHRRQLCSENEICWPYFWWHGGWPGYCENHPSWRCKVSPSDQLSP